MADQPRDILSVSGLSGGLAEYPAGSSFGPRRMHDYEFVWIMRGNVRYQHNDLTHDAPAGSIILSRPGVVERYFWDPHGVTRHAYFHFNISSMPKYLGSPARWPVIRQMPSGDTIRPVFELIAQGLNGATAPSVTWEKAVEMVLCAFVAGPLSAQSPYTEKLPEPVKRALNWVCVALDRQPDRAVTLNDLADAACVDARHLCRLFRQAGQPPPMRVVGQLRLNRARSLLERTDFKIAQIADICGFANPYHFSRQFSRSFGLSPRAIRRK